MAAVETAVSETDIFASSTGNFYTTLDHMLELETTGQFCNEIDFASSESLDGKKVVNVIPQKIISSSLSATVCVIVPASGRRLDLGCPTGNHALFILCSFTNQVLAKLDLMRSSCWYQAYKNDVYLFPKQLDVLVASLHPPSFGAALTVFAHGGYSVLHCFFDGQLQLQHFGPHEGSIRWKDRTC